MKGTVVTGHGASLPVEASSPVVFVVIQQQSKIGNELRYTLSSFGSASSGSEQNPRLDVALD